MGQPRRRLWASALIAVLIGLAGTSTSAFAAGPKPDPPPVKRVPPPPPAPRPAPPPPPVYVQPRPPPPVDQAPRSGPTPAQVLAAKRAAARANAAKRAKAQRLKKQRMKRRAELIAAASRAATTLQRATAGLLAPVRQISASGPVRDERGSAGKSVRPVLPVLVLTTLGGLVVLGFGLVPAGAVPRSRISAVLEEHHGHLTLAGGALISFAISFAVTRLLTK